MTVFLIQSWLKKWYKAPVTDTVSICGLALGFVVFLLGLLYVDGQRSFDRGFTNYRNIYRVETNLKADKIGLLYPQNVSTLFAMRTPAIQSMTRFYEIPLMQSYLRMDNGRKLYVDHTLYADSSFFHVFDYPFVFGTPEEAFSDPHNIVLSKTLSIDLFGKDDPVGKIVSLGDEGDFVIKGVFNDQVFPSHLTVEMIRPMPLVKPGRDQSSLSATYVYLALDPHASALKVTDQLTRIYHSSGMHVEGSISLEPLKDLYLNGRKIVEIARKGNATTVWLVTCLSFFILLTSLINFANFNLIQTAAHIKESMVRRCLGASLGELASQMYVVVCVKCLLALVLATLTAFFCFPMLDGIGGDGKLADTIYLLVMQVGAVFILVVLSGGILPLLHLTTARFSEILKGGRSKAVGRIKLRQALFVVQVTITCVFIGGVLVARDQIRYIQARDPGFDSHQILVLQPGNIQTQFQYQAVKARLMQIPGVEAVSYASAVGLPNESTATKLVVGGNAYATQYLCVDTSYFRLLKARFVSGGPFSDSLNTIIVNQTLADMIGLRLAEGPANINFFGKKVHISGIVEDLNFYGYENKITPMVFTPSKYTLTPFLLVRLTAANSLSTVTAIRRAWTSIEPEYDLRSRFLDKAFEDHFNAYKVSYRVFRFFVVSAIAIALVGLISLVSLVVQQRTKEIAIRKVHGAEVAVILRMLNMQFVWMVLLANMLAIPLTYYLAGQWLASFAYRIEISMSYFVSALAVTNILTVAVVSIRAFRSASMSPINYLRED